ncbi:hypothetical protein [Streptomyces asoensis]|uniref:Integral membrane protein n=1 Tax=Streptomyces asoensis TaxID=249586 RepID=A0ABQ3RS45_9ACTN|nr:hypothetical protein [Streptomyces asoensis]GGQ45791.1 hypothetical protein GCM10010496_04270 [Streptomyces asoensis]GHI58685.1 hypothetical protein Saso_03350 [Streptomyces asoensis]
MGDTARARVVRLRSVRLRLMRLTALHWLTLSVLSCGALFVVWLWGVWSGGLDVAETCTLLRGQKYDEAYRAEHWREPSQIFPLHNRCNASYDLVPAWINPALVLLALLASVSLVLGVTRLVLALSRTVGRLRARLREREAARSGDGPTPPL